MFKVGDAVFVKGNGCNAEHRGVMIGIDRADPNLTYKVEVVYPSGRTSTSWYNAANVRLQDVQGVDTALDDSYKVGEVVTLRSGGPWMTVAQLNGSEIGCAWFSGDGEILRREYFTAECLKKVANEP